jgi:hypothetical protein
MCPLALLRQNTLFLGCVPVMRTSENPIPVSCDTNGRTRRTVHEDNQKESVIERLLILAFVMVMGANLLYFVSGNLRHVWQGCVSKLHSAVVQAQAQ